MQVIQMKDDSDSDNGGGSEVMRKDHLDPKGSDSGYTLKESNGKMWHIRESSQG